MQSLAGRFLVAKPSLRDGFFGRSVVLLLEHDANGAIGLVLNRPAQSKELPFPVYVGGPCEVEGLLMLHGQVDWLDCGLEKTPSVCPGVFLGSTSSFEKMQEVSTSKGWKFKVFAGYAGWAPNQLEGELQEGSWYILPAKANFVFETPADQLWFELVPSPMPSPSLN